MIKRVFQVLLLFINAIFLFSCQNNRWNINVDNITINQEFKRFDKDLFEVDADSIWNKVHIWEKEYGSFVDIYNTHIIRIGGTNQLDYNSKLNYFLTDPDIYGAYLEAQEKIKTEIVFEQITEAFKHYKYYFPKKTIPDIYTHISGFNQSIVIDSNYLSIALDKYLGPQSKYYQLLRTPKYLRANMHSKKIPSDVMFSWAETEFNFNNETENLINKMIYYGKLHVYLDAMLPETVDSLKWGFSAKQLKWCKKSESQMWLYLVENKLLFSTAYKEINKYINEGPFTSTFSKNSPARTGRWIGYRIVKAYMEENPKITLQQLMANNNYQQILTQSKYKP